MRITLFWLATLLCFTSVCVGADFALAPPKQVVTGNQYTNALKRDPWEKDRWNYIDPKTGIRTGGFIKKDQWEPCVKVQDVGSGISLVCVQEPLLPGHNLTGACHWLNYTVWARLRMNHWHAQPVVQIASCVVPRKEWFFILH